MTTTWTISSGPSGNFPAGVEAGEAACGSGHQESVAVVDHALRVGRFDMRMPAGDAMFVADAADGGHRFDDGGVIVLPRMTEILRQITLADQHHADALHCLQYPRQVVDGHDVLAHDDDENLAVRNERPHVSLLVVVLRCNPPVASGMYGLVAAHALWLVRRRFFRAGVPAR